MHAGRIRDMVETGKLSLSAVKYFVLDEADRLLDTGNQDLILNLFSRFPKAGTGAARLQVYTSHLGTCDLTLRKQGINLQRLTDGALSSAAQSDRHAASALQMRSCC